MKLRYQYRIYPTDQQIQLLVKISGCCRYVFNQALAQNIKEYDANKKFIWYNQLANQLPQMKRDNDWLKLPYSQSLQQSLKQLDQALKNLKHGAKFPRFKSKYTTPISIHYPQHVMLSDDSKHVIIPKLGQIKIKLHRSLPNYTGVTITQKHGKWYISFVVEVQEAEIKEPTNYIGIDLNSEYIALSNQELIPNPKPLRKKSKKLKSLQRQLSRTQKKSKNRVKKRAKLSTLHGKIARIRKEHSHQVSARIAKVYGLVAVESLDIAQMKRNHLTAKAVQDSNWRQLITYLKYKCRLQGHHLIEINQWLPSSKMCSSCGHKKELIDLKQRTYDCDECGINLHRDTNAAINIANWGLQQYKLQTGQELPSAPVDWFEDLLSNIDGMSSTELKQEVLSLQI